ncbi:MAG: hypothetical protein OXF25_11590 [Cyanobacteria bacterium MAG CAR3_bin_5]|nr:hypothetical protein [Cyanobacteria bacterium MAG CAR3_bin_5]
MGASVFSVAAGRSSCPRRRERQRHGTPPGLHPRRGSTTGSVGRQCPVCGFRDPLPTGILRGGTARLLARYWQDNCHLASSVLVEGQAPWAGIITCADSRAPPGWIFDANPGQLFVVRSAGNTAFDDGAASFHGICRGQPGCLSNHGAGP